MNKEEVNKLFEDMKKLSVIEQIITIAKVVYKNADNRSALLLNEKYFTWSAKNIEAITKLSDDKLKIIKKNIDLPMEEIMKLI